MRMPESASVSRESAIFEAQPLGLCAGVVRAVNAYDSFVRENPGETIYSVGEPAHNTHIINRFRGMGVQFVERVSEVPDGGKALFGPHGSTPDDIKEAKSRGLTYVDTECPLVSKVKREVLKSAQEGKTTIYYGQTGHAETRAVMGVAPESVILVESVEQALAVEVPDPERIAFNNQTTHNADEAMEMAHLLTGKYPELVIPPMEDACYATRNRQEAVKSVVSEGIDAMVVVGSATSSNSKRLKEVAEQRGVQVFFVDSVDELSAEQFSGVSRIGLTAGASVEDDQVELVRNFLSKVIKIDIEKVIVADETKIAFAPPTVHLPNS